MIKDKKEQEKAKKGTPLKRPLTPETSESETETDLPRNSSASSAKKAKLSCPNCDFVAFEQFYMDIHKEVCKGQETVEDKPKENEVEDNEFGKQDNFDDDMDNGPATPKVEVRRILDIFRLFVF